MLIAWFGSVSRSTWARANPRIYENLSLLLFVFCFGFHFVYISLFDADGFAEEDMFFFSFYFSLFIFCNEQKKKNKMHTDTFQVWYIRQEYITDKFSILFT